MTQRTFVYMYTWYIHDAHGDDGWQPHDEALKKSVKGRKG
jgi:hypothetical protein